MGGVQVDDFDIREDLEKIQPAPIDIKGTISPEDVTGVPELPRGVCTGELIAASNATATTSAGDMLRVIRGRNKQTFKGTNGPPELTTGGKTMKLFFKSNKKKHGEGATCIVECV